jgi:hypothetical protein
MIVTLSTALSAGCSTPFHLSDAYITSTPRSPGLDIAVLTCEPVATLDPVAASAIQGLGPTVSHALTTALWQATPPIRAVPIPEMMNRLTDQGLAAEYADVLRSPTRGRVLEREQLRRIGVALGSRYVLQPGLAEFSQTLLDKLDVSGLQVVRTRMSGLRLWLQLWDAQTGHLLWESTGEVTVLEPVFRQDITVSLDAIARALWSRMIDDLLGATTGSSGCP